MRRIGSTLAAAVVAPLLAAAPVRACDVAEMQAAQAEVCAAALAEPAAVLAALLPRLEEAERGGVAARLAAARALCETGDPALGAAEAARLARLAGRLEARLGEAPPIWPDRRAETGR